MGALMGVATLAGVGTCELAGDLGPGNVGTGVLSCRSQCFGTWVLAEI
jgi:hypothetical protein